MQSLWSFGLEQKIPWTRPSLDVFGRSSPRTMAGWQTSSAAITTALIMLHMLAWERFRA